MQSGPSPPRNTVRTGPVLKPHIRPSCTQHSGAQYRHLGKRSHSTNPVVGHVLSTLLLSHDGDSLSIAPGYVNLVTHMGEVILKGVDRIFRITEPKCTFLKRCTRIDDHLCYAAHSVADFDRRMGSTHSHVIAVISKTTTAHNANYGALLYFLKSTSLRCHLLRPQKHSRILHRSDTHKRCVAHSRCWQPEPGQLVARQVRNGGWSLRRFVFIVRAQTRVPWATPTVAHVK